MDQPCTPWMAVDGIVGCCESDFAAGVLTEAVDTAISWLFVRSGRKYQVCPDLWRPCTPCGCAGWVSCGCVAYSSIELRREPLVHPVADPPVDPVAVIVDGVTLDLGIDYMLDETGPTARLLRLGGLSWPCCQDIGAPAGQPGTWSISYQWGFAPLPGYRFAVSTLACEIAKAVSGGKCRLPQRLTNIVREGISSTILDPLTFLDSGLFGLPTIDNWLTSAGTNPLPRVLDAGDWPLPTHDPTNWRGIARQSARYL